MEDRILLLQPERERLPFWRRNKLVFFLLLTIGICSFAIAVGLCIYKNAFEGPIALSIISLNCWGVPANFGSYDKEARMHQIGRMIQKQEHDLYLLEELWMRPDHYTIQTYVNSTGYYMTEVGDLALYGMCDGRVAPTECSGLAIVSKYPIIEKEFNVFSVHGNYFNFDGEAFARKGVGRIRISPMKNVTVDVFVTHTAASTYNYWYREIQTKEVVEHVKSSTADFAILGGDFNIDPRMTNETTYETLTSELKSAMHDFFGYLQELLRPSRATYGNPENTYSSQFGPQLYDYIFHRSQGWNAVTINFFKVPILKALIDGDMISSNRNASVESLEADSQNNVKEVHSSDKEGEGLAESKVKESSEDETDTENESSRREKRSAGSSGKTVSLSDHEAVTSDLLLFKYRW